MIRNTRTEKNFKSENENEMTMAACLCRIYKKVDMEGLSEDAAEKLAEDVKVVSDNFGVSPKAAILLSAILEQSNCCNGCDENDLSSFVGCTNIEFISSFHNSVRELEDCGIIGCTKGRHKSYCVSPEAIKAVEKDCKFVPVKLTDLTAEELFSRLRGLFGSFRNDVIDGDCLYEDLQKLIERNQQLLFCRKVLDAGLFENFEEVSAKMFLYICHRYVSHGNPSVPIDILMNFTEFMDDDQKIRRHFSLQKTDLQTSGLVTFGNVNGFADEKSIALSDEVKNTYFEEIELAKEETVNYKNLTSCDSIKEEQLFYNPKEEEQIERLASLLENDNFVQVQQRLEEQSLPKGFCCLFEGPSGTGKTASIRALAKRTGRDLFMVDLSAIRGKFVGESEQNVGEIFRQYRDMVRTKEKAPILAINEADALFNKRMEVKDSVDIMNNNMTDIILNELENLDGILIGSTNLLKNISGKGDNALARRFIFKVSFSEPQEEVRAKIWKSKLNDLSDEDAATLAKKYSFSGGNIQNVARKATIDYVLSGKRPEIDSLVKYCDEELFSNDKKKETKKIGFAE